MRVSRLKPLIVDAVLDTLRLRQDRLDLARDLGGAAQRGRVRQLHVQEQEALVLLGDEPRGQPAPQVGGEQAEAEQDREAERRLAHEAVGDVHVAVGHAREAAVEGAEEAAEHALATRGAAAGSGPRAPATGSAR